jgi:hypothetical protein
MSTASAPRESEREMNRAVPSFAAILVGAIGLWDRPAFAYRPFNSTDAAVATRGDLEIECGPFGYVVDLDGRFLVIPTAIVNIGIADGWEIVIEGRNFLRVASINPDRTDTVRHLSLDAGWRVARSQGSNLREVRAGFTWAFPIREGSDARRTAPQPAVSRSRLGA